MTDRTQHCAGCKGRQDHIEKLEADNARLREALSGMLAYSSFNERWQDNHPKYVEKARAALAKRGLEVREVEG